MKYRELIQFEPIDTVIQLKESDDPKSAQRLVETYVISDEMAEKLADIVAQQLRFDKPGDKMGIMVVGNYGTGKSHLMAVISSVCESKELVKSLKNERVREAFTPLGGKFKVVRAEIGTTTMSLRDIVVAVLQDSLSNMKVDFTFPSLDKTTGQKVPIENMMKLFHEVYPDHALLLVIDELLDYLRGRRDQELVLDLGFLRELGESCKNLKFRFIAGVQEAIFDSSRFAFVAEPLRRVRDRFIQVMIARNDVKFVVVNRLLKKRADQTTRISDYLMPFTKFYGNMNERIEEFVELFPVHPDYITTFENIRAAEKREILKTLSQAMKSILDTEVPADRPGLIAYDSYWKILCSNPVFRATPEIREVVDCSQILEQKVNASFPKAAYKSMAIKIIHGLSVNRLTTGNINSPIGLTTIELRDSLCLYQPGIGAMGGIAADDLLTQVETVVKDIMRSVSGQFVSVNPQNQQYYLDLKKTEDYDARIEQRLESLDKQQLDRYYYEALKNIIGCSDDYKFTGYKIWQHELTSIDHNAPHLGWLFFGAPNERSTAVPPLDFYIYFLQPHDPPSFKDEKRSDEVFFRLTGADDAFNKSLKHFTAAALLSLTASGNAKSVYESNAELSRREIVNWLQQHITTAFEITYQGKTKSFSEWIKGKYTARVDAKSVNVRDTVNLACSTILANHFDELAPEYPKFTTLLTSENLYLAAQDAIRNISVTTRTRQASAVLDALELLDGDRIDIGKSRYANYILDLMSKKGHGQVVNHNELLEDVYSVEYMSPGKYRLQPELVAVVLSAMVYSGDIVLSIPGKNFDAANFTALIATPIVDLVNFKHFEKPKDWNRPGLKAIFELVGLPPGLVQSLTDGRDGAVQQLQSAVIQNVENLVNAQQHLSSLTFLGRNILSSTDTDSYKSEIEKAKQFLESLQAFNTTGKLKNFQYTASEVEANRKGITLMKEVESLYGFCNSVTNISSYLSTAEAVLPIQNPWLDEVKKAREELVADIADPAKRGSSAFRQQVLGKLSELKKKYMVTYIELHSKARLNLSDDNRKKELRRDSRLTGLDTLSAIGIMPIQQLKEYKEKMASLQPCFSLIPQEMENSPVCPNCSFRPLTESVNIPASKILDSLSDELDNLVTEWTQTLLSNLDDPVAQSNIALLKSEQKKIIRDFVKDKKLPEPINLDFVSAVNEALSSLIKVSVKVEELKAALLYGGTPMTIQEIKSRFESFLQDKSKGKDPSKIRIALE
jgi:hypothetical protein